MKQAYHYNATTNVRLRKEISNSKATNLELSEKIGVSENTISKWKTEKFLKIKVQGRIRFVIHLVSQK